MTPRANGQAERLNKSINLALLATAPEEERWDENLGAVQRAINCTVNRSTSKAPSELLFGYLPRHGSNSALKDEVSSAVCNLNDLVKARQEALVQITASQKQQKRDFDKR